MKRFSLFLLLSLALCFTAQAQLTKGTRFLGAAGARGTGNAVYGGLGQLSTNFGNDITIFGLRVTPDLGYFLSDHVLLGSSIVVSTTTDFEDSFTSVGAAPFVRYYFNPESTGNTYFYGQAQVGFIAALDESDFKTYPFGLQAGVTHFLAPGIGLDAYLQFRDSDLSTDNVSSLGIGATLNIYLNDEMYNNRKSGTASLQRGTLMIGGTGSASFGLGDNISRGISLVPQLFYFLNPQLAIGGSLQTWFSRSEFSGFQINNTILGISPQMRYYLSTGEHCMWFIGGGLNINHSRAKNDFFGVETSISDTNVGFGLGGGVNSFLTPNIALEIGPSLRINPANETVQIGIDLGVQFFLNTGE
ncbi:outer membrane beta-barrel protein [Lewinella sp. LCG006]|uniref:outer membrane beta-barrel protein n=1 Tax=Lewinella sp. LCG006 TaxID=3231911 RepID=UPI00345F4E47